MVRSNVKRAPRVLKQSSRMYVPRRTQTTPMNARGVNVIGFCCGSGSKGRGGKENEEGARVMRYESISNRAQP
jgi:hypothetical protein